MIVIKRMYSGYGDHMVLKNINLDITDRGVTCIIGPNGAGKTTLLRTIIGMLGYKGSIVIDGRELTSYTRRELSRKISYSSQIDIVELLPLTVREALLTARYPVSRGFWEDREDYEAVERVARMLNIEDLIDRRLQELSMGELQRVTIALSLVKNPKYILLDEPDAHIDIGYKSSLIKLLRSIGREKSVVLSTHDILFAYLVGDNIVLIDNGEIVYRGSRNKLLSAIDMIEKVYGAKIAVFEYGDEKYLTPIYI